MKSRFGDRFAHDAEAAGYDQDVRNERDPIRKGYAEALGWLGSQVTPGSHVIDLGCGTGNTVLALPPDCTVTAVDLSQPMLQVAAQKLAGRNVRFVLSDILEFFDRPSDPVDAIVSSYALHHLTDEEKHHLIGQLPLRLREGGKLVVVDLMFKNKLERAMLTNRYATNTDVSEAIRDEFFWNVEADEAALTRAGFDVTQKRFSDLSWGILATLRHAS